ncbi:AraC family transcriptional regulator [Simiduia sp. 21SJ11W-1]|uniref:AraC family transcriptional regulator n=1 Tax=Simiduia sp. 21SJ11W-1 TaxID=2909669 RepID=UPI00209CBD4B|nr:AraC family transcriptional regulator [Simiduia sp. 21SJ11W-1]UTA48179.1 AraC family transcriptional regulator [Simiduia sp. 21SJ11W-1]
MPYPLISKNFLTGLPELLAEQGIAPAPLFAEAGLALALQDAAQDLIPFECHNRLLLLAAKALGWPHLGLVLARRQGLFIFGPLASLTRQCRTVGEALSVFSQHLSMVVQTVDIELMHQGELAHLIVRGRFDQIARTPTFQDHALALAYDLIQVFCGNHWRPRAVYFSHPAPANIAPYGQFFHCPIGFDHPHLALVLEGKLLSHPLHPDAAQFPERLRQHLEQRHGQDLLQQLREVIALTLATDECQLSRIAGAIGYSARTLQRHLQQQGTSFQKVQESVRQQQAQHYLGNGFYRITDVAAMLGFSELSAFTRSFKRWFGVSPQTWRARHQRQIAPAMHK